MSTAHLTRAQQMIQHIQSQYDILRKSTYKTVHDQIGSTLSTVSIKSKLLMDKTPDPSAKKQLHEMHALIKECMEYVTTLNRQLKQGWTPQSRETFIDDLQKDLNQFATPFHAKVKLEINGDNHSKKLSFSNMMLIHEWLFEYQKHAISRLAQQVKMHADFSPTQVTWELSDDAPMELNSDIFQELMQKTQPLGGTFQAGKKQAASRLTLSLGEET